MMTHCTNCGQHLKENAKYCANCGAAIKILQQMNSYDVYLTISVNLVGDNNDFTNSFVYVPHLSKSIKVKIPNNISVGQKLRLKNLGNIMPDGSRGNLYLVLDKIDHYQVLQSPTPKGNQSSRQIVYEGKLHKCPNCGELLNSFAMTCPSCGYEIRDSLTSESVINFANRLMNVESENAKITLIRNFPIPNTKEDILEFIILAATNITREQSLNISSAWRAKFEQCYEKAKLTLSRNEDFQTIQEIYDKARRRIRREKLVKNVKNCAIKIFSNLRIIMKAIIKYVPNMLSKILNLVMSHVLSILGILSFMKAISIDQRGGNGVGYELLGGVLFVFSFIMIMIKHATYVDILIWGSAIFLTFYLSGFLKNGALLQLIGALLSIFAIIMLLNTAITKSNKKK